MLKKIQSKLNTDSNLNELVSGSAITFFLKIGGMGLAYLVVYLIAQKNGAEGIGYYSLVNRLLLLIGLVVVLGTNVSILRYVGQFNNDTEQSKLPDLFSKIVTIVLPTAIVGGILLYLFSDLIATKVFLNKDYSEAIQLIAFALPLHAIDLISIEFIRGLKKLKISEFVRSIIRPALILTSLIIVWQTEIPNIFIIYAYCGSILISLLVSLTVVLRNVLKFRKQIGLISSNVEYKELFKVSSPMMVSEIASMLIGSLSVFVLEYFASTEEVGIFSLALRLSQVILIIIAVINTISAPKFSELFWSKKHDELQKLIRQSAKILFYAGSFISIVLALTSFWILDFFGSEFTEGQIALLILIGGQFFNAVSGSVGLILNMSGNQKVFRNTAILSLVIQTILAIVTIPVFGIVGAAIATSATTIVWNLINLIYVQQKLNLKTYYFPILTK